MDKNFLLYVAAGIAFIYFITNFIGDIQEEDEKFRSSKYQSEQQYNQYIIKDSIGRDILDLTDAPVAQHVKIWNSNKKLKEEFLDDFPDFSLMKLFVKERTRGESFQAKLLNHIDHIELRYFSGKLNAEQAKKELDAFSY
ncbi:MAG: hypothetical protein ABXS92_01740 [Sulfurimonas sp.]